ncbi:MAG: hypothetical protein AAFO95_21045, partial [Cyanobacteria bacterium J06600_6]
WCTIRMPSRQAYEALSKQNSMLENDAFARFDTLANKADLSRLFEVLTSFKDQHGNHPVITANTIVANPDFPKIEAGGFEEYSYEPFYETIKRQPDGGEILGLWKEGIEQGVFRPQLHGREHVHVPAWLRLLRAGNEDLLAAFKWQCFGVPYRSRDKNKRRNLQAAFDYHDLGKEQAFQRLAVTEAAQLFYDYFGYFSRSFIAPAYIWHPVLEETLRKVDVQILQGISLQYIPQSNSYQKKIRFTGQVSASGVRQVVRNCFFEPVLQPNRRWEDQVLKRIAKAFKVRKPAILGTHRINFVGSLSHKNRDESLIQLRAILRQIQKNWPEVEFIATDQLVLN